MPTATTPAPRTATVQADPNDWIAFEKALRSEIVEAEPQIHALMLALLARAHLFLLGTPGIAKSMLFDRAFLYILGARKFKLLLDRFTVPDQIIGVPSLKGLENDELRRILDGYMAAVELAMLDEIWKANNATANSLLGILHEREITNNGIVESVPLATMVCTSNELPQGAELNAIADRIDLWVEVREIQEPNNFIKMLETELDKNPEPILDWKQIEAAQQAVAKLPVPRAVTEELANIRHELREQGISPTPRRFKKALSILRAEAWLDGCDEVGVEHLGVLVHSFWREPEQQAEVERIVLARANPYEKGLLDLLRAINSLGHDVERAVQIASTDRDRAVALGTEAYPKLAECKIELLDLGTKIGAGRKSAELVDRTKTRLHEVTVRLIKDVMNLPIEGLEI